MTALKAARPTATGGTAYADDFYTWTQEQGARLRAGDLSALDREDLAEEIESLGRSEFGKLVAAFRDILRSILVFDHRPDLPARDGALLIAAQRLDVTFLLKDSPGLKDRSEEAMARAYQTARLGAADAAQLPLSRFPETCPYNREDLMRRPFAIDPDDTTA
ncbi:DUF29 domain-containing protein [Methylobacterium trifolii]|uniref:DUF29 domain-containing protein n=1 Tax=Methylobacterium trifolii TaxID=1003092 RepID=A0ABQ4U2J4_9HYPH|nr:DUF29 domain-containing protein [Methylobacterium trifolii]GJE61708.1 hypothetical protein MPOCJGCO_3831 [Methylobacterium trifolii]